MASLLLPTQREEGAATRFDAGVGQLIVLVREILLDFRGDVPRLCEFAAL
jgi:hypothetical protein